MLNLEDGQSKTHDFLGQNIKEFKRTHIPEDGEPYKDCKLSEMNYQEIERISFRMAREKDYESTTYYGTRKDGSQYIIAQVGDNGNDIKKYYRYYYADVSKDGKLSNQAILYSDTNVAHFINARKFGLKAPDGYEEAIDNILFSKENIKDSLEKRTFYIGSVRKNRSDNKFELVSNLSEVFKGSLEKRAFNYPTKQYKRDDGSSFIVQQMTREKAIEGIEVNSYHIFELVNKNGKRVLKRNVVYSEQDLFKDHRKGIENILLSRERIDRKANEAGGYVGYYSKNGMQTHNSKLERYFKSTESERIRPKKVAKSKGNQLTPEQMKRKMSWVKDFIKDYEETESINSYVLRANCEDDNIIRVVDSVKSGKFTGDFDNNAMKYEDDSGLFMGKLITSMARLLKEADNLTIDRGTNYLEEFVSIPEVNKILLQIRDDEQSKQMHKEAEQNRKNGNLPEHTKTRAEIDKQYAQDYLKSIISNHGSVEQEIIYRKQFVGMDLVKISDLQDLNDVPLRRIQQISLTRLLARQNGKVPSKAYYDKRMKGWYCKLDIKSKNKKVNAEASDTYDITPETITEATKRLVGIQEINNSAQEIRRAINNPLQLEEDKYFT